MKLVLHASITLALLGCAEAAPPAVEHLARLPPAVDLGAYDNQHKLDDLRTLKYEMIWCDLDKYRNGKLRPELTKIASRGRTPIVTVEPYPIPRIGGSETLLPDITGGKYDDVILAMATETDSLGSPVFIRFAPEMDMATDKPYARKLPEIFIPAYQHFVSVFREACPTSVLIWTSVGNQGGEKYYPGDDYVDYTGYSLYEQADASKLWCGHERSFAQWMDEKYPAFARLGKPVIITELGICGSPQKQRSWMEDAFATVGNYPLVKALIYFNAQDTVSWRKWGAPRRTKLAHQSFSFLELSKMVATDHRFAYTPTLLCPICYLLFAIGRASGEFGGSRGIFPRLTITKRTAIKSRFAFLGKRL